MPNDQTMAEPPRFFRATYLTNETTPVCTKKNVTVSQNKRDRGSDEDGSAVQQHGQNADLGNCCRGEWHMLNSQNVWSVWCDMLQNIGQQHIQHATISWGNNNAPSTTIRRKCDRQGPRGRSRQDAEGSWWSLFEYKKISSNSIIKSPINIYNIDQLW